MGRGRLRLSFLLSLVAAAASIPAPQEDVRESAQEDINTEDMPNIFRDLFIPSREARELSDEDGDEDVQDVSSDNEEEEDYKVMEDTEAMDEARVMEVARFNNYIDAIYRRMNAALRAKMMDPMELNLNDKANKKTSDKKKITKRDAEEDDDEENHEVYSADDDEEDDDVAAAMEIDHRMGKNENKKGKGKKVSTSRKKKNGKKGKGKGKGKNKEEREAAKKEKQKQKLKKQEERMKKREEKKKKKGGNRESRSGSNKKKKKNHNKNKKSAKKPSHVGKSKNKNQNTKKGRKHNKKQTVNKKRSDLKVQDNKMLGSLSGIATLRRQGDVSVTDEDNHKIVMSEFQVGPLQLEVSRVYGNGKGRTVKSAKAITDIMTGVMTLKVKPDGTAHVKKVVFKPPENVDVKGSLSDDRPRNLRYVKNSVNKMRPLAALRILKTARYVLKAPSSN